MHPQPALKESLTPDQIRKVYETIYELFLAACATEYRGFPNNDQAETWFGRLFELLEAPGE